MSNAYNGYKEKDRLHGRASGAYKRTARQVAAPYNLHGEAYEIEKIGVFYPEGHAVLEPLAKTVKNAAKVFVHLCYTRFSPHVAGCGSLQL
jgi:hypothetical protein